MSKLILKIYNKHVNTKINNMHFKVLNEKFQDFHQAMVYCDKRLISYYHIAKI